MADGSVIIEVEGESNDIENDLENVRSRVAKLAAEYKKAGMTSSDAMKKAWSEIGSTAKNAHDEIGEALDSIGEKAQEASGSLSAFQSDKPKKLTKSLQELTDIVDKQEYKLEQLKTNYQDLYLTQGKNSDKAKDCAKQIDKLSSELNENREKLKEASDAADKFDNSLKDVSDEANDAQSGISSAFKSVKSTLVALGIGTAIKEIGTSCIEAAASVKAANSQFAQTFGDLADEADAAMERVATSSGILQTRLQSVGTGIYAFARTTGMDTTEALGMMERALTVTADSAAYYDRSLEDVSESLQSFLKGNYENDAALGLSCTETTRNAAANELYGQSFNDLSEAQKQLTLLKMVEDANELSGAMGQAAREADGWENVTGNLSEAWNQLLAALGTPILPYVTKSITGLSSVLQTLTESFQAGGFAEVASVGSEMLSSLADGIRESLPQMISAAMESLVSFSGGLRDGVGQLVDSGLELISNLAQGIIDSIPTLIETVPEIVTNIANIINDNAPKLLDTGITLIGKLAIGLVKAIPTLIANIPQIIEAIIAVFTAFSWVNLGKQIIDFFGSGLSSMKGTVVAKIKEICEALKSKAGEFPAKLKEIGHDLIVKLAAGIVNRIADARNSAGEIGDAIKTKLDEFPNKIKSIGGDIVSGLWNGINDKIQWLKDKISSFVGDVTGWLKNKFGINSPSKVMRDEVGKWLPMGIGVGVAKNTKYAVAAATDMAKRVVSAASLSTARMLLVADTSMAAANATTAFNTHNVYNNSGSSVVYNQTINSPKAMSRREVRRETKNVVRRLRIYA